MACAERLEPAWSGSNHGEHLTPMPLPHHRAKSNFLRAVVGRLEVGWVFRWREVRLRRGAASFENFSTQGLSLLFDVLHRVADTRPSSLIAADGLQVVLFGGGDQLLKFFKSVRASGRWGRRWRRGSWGSCHTRKSSQLQYSLHQQNVSHCHQRGSHIKGFNVRCHVVPGELTHSNPGIQCRSERGISDVRGMEAPDFI